MFNHVGIFRRHLSLFTTLVTAACSLIFHTSVMAQQGCTDPRATNFSASATDNDGSCLYASTRVTFSRRIALPNSQDENSGLLFDGTYLWSHNDSGGQPALYKLDTNGTLVQTVVVANASNNDWEDLASDAQFIYIGDFGNNNGTRTDLRVLRIRKADIGTGTNVSVVADFIRFRYADQQDFSQRTGHNFDCEAVVCWNDTLHLFTKNHGNRWTKHYALPAQPGSHVLTSVDSFNVRTLITGAAITQDNAGQPLVTLLGYDVSTFTNCLWLLWDMKSMQRVWSGNKRRLELPGVFSMGQTESVAYKNLNTVYVGNERQSPINQSVVQVSLGNMQSIITTLTGATAKPELVVSPNPAQQRVVMEHSLNAECYVEVLNANGQLVYKSTLAAGNHKLDLDTSSWPLGKYYVSISAGSAKLNRAFILQ